MTDKDLMFAQNWVEQFRCNVMAQANTSLTDHYLANGRYAYGSIMAITWSRTPEDMASGLSVWCHRYEGDLNELIR